jgi:hypothetical protein
VSLARHTQKHPGDGLRNGLHAVRVVGIHLPLCVPIICIVARERAFLLNRPIAIKPMRFIADNAAFFEHRHRVKAAPSSMDILA